MHCVKSAVLFAFTLFGIVACDACKPSLPGGTGTQVEVETPSLRLYLLSDPAGALEPCGCVKDQLGGMDHLAAFIRAEQVRAPVSALLVSGPTFYMDLERKSDRAAQDDARADTIADTLSKLNLLALVPNKNDTGPGRLEALSSRAKAPVLGDVQASLRTVGAFKLGLLGVQKPADGEVSHERVASEAKALRAQGARATIVLFTGGRGDAKRLADRVPELTAILVGSASSIGEGNTETPSGERIGNVLIAATGNHVQTVGVLDLFVRGEGEDTFQDASSLQKARARSELSNKMNDLRSEIAGMETDRKDAAAIASKRSALELVRKERDALDHSPAPAKGNYARYRTEEVRATFGNEPETEALMKGYYKLVNESNKKLFADRKPAEPAKGQPGYVGIAACVDCHREAKAVWDKTAHAHAYKTLSDQSKEFNLDCVSCHVTGYDKPGGSTVTFVEKLQDVQCEVCHGPGSLHAKQPKVAIPVPLPSADSCLTCHHPPHVHSFDAAAKRELILGPGHGR